MVEKIFKLSVEYEKGCSARSAVEDGPHAYYMGPITAQEAHTPPLVANTAPVELVKLEIARY